MLNKQKGITLIALIITIIVMLILVGVTVNVALNGGLFSKAEEATTKTKIAQIQEALMIKKAEVLAENDGKSPADYGITIAKLNLPTELKTEYENKLIISKEGILYYDASVVTNEAEQNRFKEMGIKEYEKKEEPPIVYETAYHMQNGSGAEVFIYFYSNNTVKSIVQNMDITQEGSYEIRNNVEMIVEGDARNYDNAVYIKMEGESDFSFYGYLENKEKFIVVGEFDSVQGNIISLDSWLEFNLVTE